MKARDDADFKNVFGEIGAAFSDRVCPAEITADDVFEDGISEDVVDGGGDGGVKRRKARSDATAGGIPSQKHGRHLFFFSRVSAEGFGVFSDFLFS